MALAWALVEASLGVLLFISDYTHTDLKVNACVPALVECDTHDGQEPGACTCAVVVGTASVPAAPGSQP